MQSRRKLMTMNNTDIGQIFAQLQDHEKRLAEIEKNRSGLTHTQDSQPKTKQQTLPELVKGKTITSGQKKIAIIVGYYEKILGKSPINESEIKSGWRIGKLDGKYANTLLQRAEKDALIRNFNGDIDLSQTGEQYFADFIKENNE